MLKNSRLNRILAFLAIGVFFSLIATMFFLRLEIEDVWFHIKIGEQIVKHGVLPFYDTFSYTSSNIRWLATQWLGEVILFFTYNSFGLVGLQLFRCLYFTAVLLLLFFFIRRTLSISSAFLIIIPVSFIFAQRYFSRPFIFNILFVLLYLYILTSHHRDPFKKVVLAIPFLHFIWQNIYIGGAYISLFLLAVFLAGSYLDYHKKQLFIERKDLFMLIAACAGCSWLNPYGLEGLVYPLRIFFTPRQQDMFVANKVISEWKPSFRSFSEIFSFSGLMYKGLIVVTFIALLSRIKKVCRTQAVLFLSFLLISLVAVRFRDLFALVAACVYAQASLDCEGRVIQAGWKARPPITRLIKIICGLILFSALLWRGIDFFTSQVEMQGKKIRRYGAGIDIENSPEGALRFIDSNNLAGHIYNSTSFGSYMIWRDYPRRKVFMDMRADLYCLSGVFQKLIALNQRENWERLVKQYDIAVVMLNTTFNEDRNGSVTRHILASNKWACVYLDGPSVVFLKKDKFPAEFLKQHEIRIFEKLEIGPDDFGEYLLRGPIPQNRFSRSVLARVNNFPEPLDCVTKGNWFINIESFDQALLEYKKALKINPLLDGADFWIGYCFYKKARFDYADIFINRALKASFSNPDVLLLAAGLAKTKDIQVAFNYYKQAVRYNPRHVKARELLADFAFRENFYKEALDSYLWLSNKNPADIDYRLKIGVLYGRIGKLADSKRMFEGVIVRQPDNLDAHLNLAIASRYLGLMRLCRQELEKVISLDKGNLQAKSYLLELERSGF